MEQQQPAVAPSAPDRGRIAVRLLYTILYLLVFEVIKTLLHVSVLIQYAVALITRKPAEPLRRFGNRLSAYAYRVLRYMTLNENVRPFPFADFPPEVEPGESEARFE